MADSEANDSAANDIVELEAMRKDGFSWHPCQVSLCTTELGLIVLYGNNSEEIITDKQEISARIRVRSTPLQSDDCSSVEQGERVLATESSHVEGVFYDASVEKANYVRHSKKIHCRCSFTIKWLHHHALPEEVVTVPASAIMKLATKSIHRHPTISAFFGMKEPSNSLDATLCSAIGNGKNLEMDIDVLLEQQIKEISTSHGPQENILKDYEHKVDLNPQSHGCQVEVIGFNRSENKQPAELISETPPVLSPSIQEELSGNRFLLNPLAARAALASLRSEQTLNLSAQSNEKGAMTGQHSIANLPQGSNFCSFSAVDCSSNAEEGVSLKISATIQGESPNLRRIVKKLFPTSSAPHMVEISNLSSGAEIFGTEKKNEIGEKQTTLSAEMRLTRSQIQSDNGLHGTSEMTNNNETQSRLTDTRRVTRSRVRGGEKSEVSENKKAVKDDAKPGTSTQETSIPSADDEKDVLGEDEMVIDVVTQKGYSIQDAGKQNNPKRLTRSAVSEDTENTIVQLKQKLRKKNSVESNVSIERSSIDTKSNEQSAEEGESKKMCSRSKNSESADSHGNTRQKKFASSKKQETRFSARLRFLPRTRSQNKA